MYEQILVGVILAVAGVFVFLMLAIVGNKAWRDSQFHWRERRRRVIEPEIIRYFHGAGAGIRSALRRVASSRDRRVIEQVLIDHAPHLEAAERERLALAFEEMGFVDEYLSGLRHRYWWKRADAAERLGHTRARRVTPYLTRAMEDEESSEVRLRAARALGEVGGRSAIGPLIRALNEPNRWSTIRIADVLTAMGPEALEELTAAFEDMNLHGKVAAIDIVAAIGHLRAARWLRERLGDGERDVRSRAAHALGAIGDAEAGPVLTRALRDTQWPVRAMAAKSLGAILHVDAIDELCVCLRDREWWVRSNAAEALRLMGPAGLDALERLLDDKDPYARHQAVLMLEESGLLDEEVDCLLDRAPERRAEALSLVNRLVHAGQHGRLRELAESHPRSEVRELLKHLLAEGSAQGVGS